MNLDTITLVTISGGQRSGKTELVSALKAMKGLKHGLFCRGIADSIREDACSELVTRGFDLERAKMLAFSTQQSIKDHTRKNLLIDGQPASIRELLNQIGHEAVHGEPMHWVRRCVSFFARHRATKPSVLFVVEGLRFEFELNGLIEHTGKLAEGLGANFGHVHVHLKGGKPDFECPKLAQRAHITFESSDEPYTGEERSERLVAFIDELWVAALAAE
jgi:hypothetical protein